MLTKEQLMHLRKVVNENPFWQEVLTKNFGGRDGADWFVEVKQQEVYHKAQQWSPETGKIRNIGLCLLELSRFKIDPREIY